MILKNELLQYPNHIPEKHVYLFTANKIVTKQGLVMGGGNALAAKRAYPKLPEVLGYLMSNPMLDLENTSMLFLDAFKINIEGYGVVGAFFTKNHFKDPSPLGMVITNILDLKKTAETYPKFTFHLPYPGCGLGGLTVEQLEPYMSRLPDNVIVYK